MNERIIAPSILSANFACLGEDINAVIQAGANWIHFDVMDNHYVPNLTIGPAVCKSLREYRVTVPIDVHLMITPVDLLIKPFANSGATSISFHPDATKNIENTINIIRENNCKVGIALNPNVDINIILGLENKIDLVLLMSVKPGFGGQAFMPHVLKKAKQAREIINTWKNIPRLQIDGGVTLENIKQIYASGIDTIVAGNSIFKHNKSEYKKIITHLRNS